jgi:hypothetical protein
LQHLVLLGAVGEVVVGLLVDELAPVDPVVVLKRRSKNLMRK